MRLITPFIFLFASVSLSGCSTDTSGHNGAEPQVAAPFAQSAITLEIQTDPDLNALHGSANSCTLLVIQAPQAATLNHLLSNPVTLRNLFSAAGAQDEILKVDRYPAMPGQISTLHIDRSENARYIAVVAGYYPFPQQQHMALVAIPVIKPGLTGLLTGRNARLEPLALRLRLGSTGITHFSGAPRMPLASGTGKILAGGV